MDYLIESYGTSGNRLVFIPDGATCIRNWVEDAFPSAVAILDYFHAVAHLYAFADSHFTDKEAKQRWEEKQKMLLFDSNVEQVIANINKLGSGSRIAKKLITYYEINSSRMDYKSCKQPGCDIIGSGAIESARRTLVQNLSTKKDEAIRTKMDKHRSPKYAQLKGDS